VSSRNRLQQVTSSMLWAAWADALGFISELTDANGLRRRLGGDGELKEPVAWTRKVGGRFGVSVSLPAGCYSDDTQLRLATSRALSTKGFDIEAFTAVELTLWPAYALGGGRASKSAAASFAKPNTPWFGNFYKGWTNAGGNGAAMRIQPHVWAAPRPEEPGYFQDVLLNAITTHGHPRALAGAVLHAYALGRTIADAQVIEPGRWSDLLNGTRAALNLFLGHDMVSSVWVPSWEKATGASFQEAWRDVIDELRSLLTTASDYVSALADDQTPHSETYAAMCKQLGLHDDATRGSGTATVVASLALAAAHQGDPRQCAIVASRALGTDTDTIATMAAALVGAATPEVPPTPVQDRQYLLDQARRLASLSVGVRVDSTQYPDLLTWQPPRSQVDAVGLVDGRPALAGLALLEPISDEERASSGSAEWRWFDSDLGATFLLKHRPPGQLRELPAGNRPPRRGDSELRHAVGHDVPDGQLPLLDTGTVQVAYRQSRQVDAPTDTGVRRSLDEKDGPQADVNVDQMLGWVRHKNYSDDSVGYAVRRIATLGTVEQLVAFTAELRSAVRSFQDHRRPGR
jgi:ADP-ribosylglycohydrolase